MAKPEAKKNTHKKPHHWKKKKTVFIQCVYENEQHHKQIQSND